MANPFVKAWKYVMALFNAKIDEHADPKVQIQQAIEEAQRTHQALTQQAAQVIGNQRQLEMRLNRQLADIEKLQVNVRQALTLADQATAAGDAAKATEYNNAAEAFAAQLVTAEQSVEDLKTLHDQALQAAAQAKKAVEQNAMVLQQKIAERTKLLSQLEQAKMQEQVSASLRSMSEIAAPGNTPSLDEVRDKIERRYANATRLGRTRAEFGAGPHARGRAGRRADGRSFPAGADPRVDARRSPADGRDTCRSRSHPGHSRDRGPPAGQAAEKPFGQSVAADDLTMAVNATQRGPWRGAAAAGTGHRRRSFRLGGPEDQRRRGSACAAAAPPPPRAAVGPDIHRRVRVLGGGDGGAGGLGLVRAAAGDHRLHRGRAGHSGDVVAASLPLAAIGAAAGARGPPAPVGCRRPVRPRDPRCTRWAPPNAGSSRCWA